jgi:hypothetical protein
MVPVAYGNRDAICKLLKILDVGFWVFLFMRMGLEKFLIPGKSSNPAS